MNIDPNTHTALQALAAHLRDRRDEILLAWRRAATRDADLSTPSSLTRSQFEDHVPEILEAFGRMLVQGSVAASSDAAGPDIQPAAGHGLHRWQQGYGLREVVGEWGHLNVCLVSELEDYAAAHGSVEPRAMPAARAILARFMSHAVTVSAAEYAHLREVEAASRADDLEQALEQLRRLERGRAHMLREAAHDLRGGLGLVAMSTAILKRPSVNEVDRSKQLDVLQITIRSLFKLLNDLLSLARLEAAQEERTIAPFDVTPVIAGLCQGMKPLADERSLFLDIKAPSSLLIESDEGKVRRIVQNLVLNAIEHTELGGVKVTWGDSGGVEREGWMLCVEDTGPGLQDDHAGDLGHALRAATEEVKELDQIAYEAGKSPVPAHPAPTLVSASDRREPMTLERISGEGVGLTIVKRLCELLDASLELETQPGKGTTFRVTFPSHYRSSHTTSSRVKQ